jgi:hypothetical protein
MFKRAAKVKAPVKAVRVETPPRLKGWREGSCNCTECRNYRMNEDQPDTCVTTDKQEPEKKATEKRFTMSSARKAFTDYYEDIKKHLDFDNMRDYGGGEFIVTAKPFEAVTGFTKLGSGAYAVVYALSDTKVLKVIRGTDEGYAKFVRACNENKGNPYLPKIIYEGKWAGKQVYVLERLTDEHPNRDETWTIKDNFASALRHSGRNPFITFSDENLGTVARILQDQNMTGDLHHGNMMFRGTTPVVTDPCAY